MKKLLMSLLLCVSMQATALEVEGVKLTDTVSLENNVLQLNGAGARSIVFFKMYVIGLYLAEKQRDSNVIFTNSLPKRIALHVVVGEGETERFLNGFRKGIEKNHSESQLAVLHERIAAFEQMFAPIKTVKKDDVITFDWLPNAGTQVGLNGVEIGRIAGEDFYHALLSIWLGSKPVSDTLKKELLGG